MNFESGRNLSSHSRFGAAKVREATSAENDDLCDTTVEFYWSAGKNYLGHSQDGFVAVGEISLNLKLWKLIEYITKLS